MNCISSCTDAHQPEPDVCGSVYYVAKTRVYYTEAPPVRVFIRKFRQPLSATWFAYVFPASDTGLYGAINSPETLAYVLNRIECF
jgi:hypothetical protein